MQTIASLTLYWQDNSDNEEGFRIDRDDGTGAGFVEHALVAPNQTSFVDDTISDGFGYCYRVSAFNAAGSSTYTQTECAFGLNVTLTGGGSGSVTALGVDCGDDCSETFPAGSTVTLTAVPAAGSLFAGWGGDGDCTDGTVSLDSAKTCTATFELEPPPLPTVTLTVNIAAGSGTVTGPGIDCGSDCSETFPANTSVTLTAVPAAGYVFAGWGGDSDCADGVLSMGSSTNCTASFEPKPTPTPTVTLTVNIVNMMTAQGSGDGSVFVDPAGIDCATTCLHSFDEGDVVTLTATPDATSIFTRWSDETGCGSSLSCTLTLNTNMVVSAVFEPEVFSLTVSVVGPGTVTSQTGSGIDCGEDCSETYRSGESVALTATSEQGWQLEGWSESECGSSSNCQFTMSADKTLVVTFTELPPPFPIMIGEVEVNHIWKRVPLDDTFFSDPVVVASVGYKDSEPGVVRIENVDATGFDVRFQEWDYLDGVHGFETIEYIVLERGTYILNDGTRLEADSIHTNAMKSFELVSFSQLFNTTPIVLTTVASEIGSAAVTARIRNVSADGFELRLREQEANRRRKHATERVDFVAWEPFAGPVGPLHLEIRRTPEVVTNDWESVFFETPFSTSPIFIAGIQTHNGGDTATVRSRNKDTIGAEVMVEEEQSKNPEVNHAAEAVGYIAAQ